MTQNKSAIDMTREEAQAIVDTFPKPTPESIERSKAFADAFVKNLNENSKSTGASKKRSS